jgi:hypothetical protein
MAVHEELEAILHRLQQMREQLLLIKPDEQRDDSEGEQTTMPLPKEPGTAESSLH